MGEFMDQMLGEGPPLVNITAIPGMIPGLAEDLDAGALPEEATKAILQCEARKIPHPHVEYGHLLFGIAMWKARTEREDAIRAIANVVGTVYGAPTFGSSLGDVPPVEIATALCSRGFNRTAEAWLTALGRWREAERGRLGDVLVWDVPGDHEIRAVAVTPAGQLKEVDFASYGERLVGCWGLDTIPGVDTYVTAFERAFGRGGWESHHASPEGAVKLRAALTAHCGAPRAPRILEIDE